MGTMIGPTIVSACRKACWIMFGGAREVCFVFLAYSYFLYQCDGVLQETCLCVSSVPAGL